MIIKAIIIITHTHILLHTHKHTHCAVCPRICVQSTCACLHICWQDGVSQRGSNTDGNPWYGSVGWKPLVWVCQMETPRMGLSRVMLIPNWDQGDLSNRSPICRGVHVYVYACTYMGAFECVCVSVDWVKIYGYRGSQKVEKGHRIDIAKWMYVPRDWSTSELERTIY